MGLIAERPTLVPLFLPSESVDEGSYVQLTCIASSGDTPFDFRWSLDGEPVVSSAPGTLVSRVSPQTSLLILASVALRQAGNYSCHVTNAAGRSSSSVQVKVNGNHGREALRERSRSFESNPSAVF